MRELRRFRLQANYELMYRLLPWIGYNSLLTV